MDLIIVYTSRSSTLHSWPLIAHHPVRRQSSSSELDEPSAVNEHRRETVIPSNRLAHGDRDVLVVREQPSVALANPPRTVPVSGHRKRIVVSELCKDLERSGGLVDWAALALAGTMGSSIHMEDAKRNVEVSSPGKEGVAEALWSAAALLPSLPRRWTYPPKATHGEEIPSGLRGINLHVRRARPNW